MLARLHACAQASVAEALLPEVLQSLLLHHHAQALGQGGGSAAAATREQQLSVLLPTIVAEKLTAHVLQPVARDGSGAGAGLVRRVSFASAPTLDVCRASSLAQRFVPHLAARCERGMASRGVGHVPRLRCSRPLPRRRPQARTRTAWRPPRWCCARSRPCATSTWTTWSGQFPFPFPFPFST